MKLEVPFYSQYTNVTDESWQNRACAMACLKMVMDFFAPNSNPNIDELIEKGLQIQAYLDNVGWVHAGLCMLARNHGFAAYNEEFRSLDIEIEAGLIEMGIRKIRSKLELGLPVIISCSKNFDEFHKPHQIVLVGYDEVGFYYHEPETRDDSGANRYVELETFRNHWRKFAIFVSI